MADFTPQQKKIVNRYYDNHDTIQNTKLGELLSELWLCEDAKAADKLWGKAQIALMRLGVDANKVASVVGERDVEALAKLVNQVDAGGARGPQPAAPKKASSSGEREFLASVDDGRTISQMRAERATAGGYDSLEPDNLKRALKAFRRKLKTLRLDDESKLGSKYVTSGRVSAISAIEPPRDYPAAVWAKLVELRRLNQAGQGTYQLPEDVAKKW